MKRATNLSIDEALLAAARAHGINLSDTLETALRARLKEAEAKKWLAENLTSLQAFNKTIGKSGTFGEQILAGEE